VWAAGARRREVTVMVNGRGGVVLDRLRVCFDDERAVANAGLLWPATLVGRLGIERLVGGDGRSLRPAGRGEAGAEGVDALSCDASGRRLDR
jgi:hypothetical protein